MADRYQGRPFPGRNDYEPDDGAHGSEKVESDPLAELARLIGQTDPFGTGSMQRANLQVQPHARPRSRPAYQDDYELPPQGEDRPPPTPPSWMQRAARQEAPPPSPEQDYPSSVHPLHRYAATHPPAQSDDETNYDPEPAYETTYDPEPAYVDVDARHQPDLSRYDDALYGSYDREPQSYQHDQGYADEGYTYDEEPNQEPEPKRRGGMITVAAVLALAVLGVGGAFAYRTYIGSARSGEPPIIRADAGPTKIIPSPPDGATKVPDRMTSGDGMEKIVSREETPLDPNARSVPRVVWPTPQAANPPPASAPVAAPATPTNGTMPNGEPHRIKTFAVRGDQADAGVPLAAPPPASATIRPAQRAAVAQAPAQRTASAANASANAPLSLSPQSNPTPPAPAVVTETPTRVAAANPAQIVPAAPSSAGPGGSYLVSVTSQPSEADAQASYRALQNKYPSVLGSQSPVVTRANAKSGAVTYRAGVSFGTSAEAAQFCHNYQAAGGQCWVVKN
jgi:hypothetical protein